MHNGPSYLAHVIEHSTFEKMQGIGREGVLNSSVNGDSILHCN